ncbi:hypothetical protein SC738_10465 [Legionella pneumophila serogroup 1]|uniref:hypothetical protein n=1 Tax=Legionella pneumophila TaxID=446 RepID=UPI0007708C97|nr:hypothetical protein [Legionella pneumophila]MCZ4738674.1 hypothetical protein [Legionella pneumophila]MCZ4746962.1 hypothetical protein [Legionella pneumophila]MDI9827492.1 hypothetical protein [Legionella pneumophila]MDO5159532.1 hypothetical protein [Legionella pneumophila]MDO5163016.1 hypothetical protein [Legionella pneumophila]
MESVRVKQNNEALYKEATLLKELNEQIVYVGGRIIGLLITDLIEDDVRPTYDIDVALDLGRIRYCCPLLFTEKTGKLRF